MRRVLQKQSTLTQRLTHERVSFLTGQPRFLNRVMEAAASAGARVGGEIGGRGVRVEGGRLAELPIAGSPDSKSPRSRDPSYSRDTPADT